MQVLIAEVGISQLSHWDAINVDNSLALAVSTPIMKAISCCPSNTLVLSDLLEPHNSPVIFIFTDSYIISVKDH